MQIRRRGEKKNVQEESSARRQKQTHTDHTNKTQAHEKERPRANNEQEGEERNEGVRI